MVIGSNKQKEAILEMKLVPRMIEILSNPNTNNRLSSEII